MVKAKQKKKAHIIPLIAVVIVIASVVYFVGFYKYNIEDSENSELNYNSDESVLFSPQQCPEGTKDCKTKNGYLHDCCESNELCIQEGLWEAYCIVNGACEDGETLCGGNGIWGRNGSTCCPQGTSCKEENYRPYCVPQDCGEGSSACRDDKGTIVCCVRDGGGQECRNGGTSFAICGPKGGCGAGEYECGTAGNIICCSNTESCLSHGGENNGPICVPKNPPKPGPGGGGNTK